MKYYKQHLQQRAPQYTKLARYDSQNLTFTFKKKTTVFGFGFPTRFHDSVPSFRQMSVSGVGLNRLRKTRGLQRLGFWNIFFGVVMVMVVNVMDRIWWWTMMMMMMVKMMVNLRGADLWKERTGIGIKDDMHMIEILLN